MQNNTKDILLINLGTPLAPTRNAITHYLREFLTDARVIDIKNPWRWLLVNSFLIPFRSKQTTAAYQKIWQPDGSPLLVHSQNLAKALVKNLGTHYRIKLGMRYGKPTIEQAISEFMVNPSPELIIVPLYPQYASAANGAALEKTMDIIKKYHYIPTIKVAKPFYNHPSFIDAYARILQETLSKHDDWDFLLFTYHGLPLRHIEKSGCHVNHCDRNNLCPTTPENPYCYRQHCFLTSRLLAQKINLPASKYFVSFQSRLGKTPWIKPYTDHILPLLFNQGIRKLALVSPSFVCDCLETLEEINIRLREQWQQLGGEEFISIPCLNDHPEWVTALGQIIKES